MKPNETVVSLERVGPNETVGSPMSVLADKTVWSFELRGPNERVASILPV